MGLRNYRALLRTPSVAWLLTTSLLGRAPMGMTALALVLVYAGHGSYGQAGLVIAADIVGGAISSPALGRALDRFGRRIVLLASASAYAVAMVALAVFARQPPAVVLPLAFLAGVSQPPIGMAARSLWASLLDGPRRESMYALEATMQELIFIAGPALVAALGVVGGPRLALALTGVLGLA